MKNMKKLSMILVGCLVSLLMMAQSFLPPRVDHNLTLDIDPFSCSSPVTLASTLAGGNPYYVVFYEYTGGELVPLDSAFNNEPKTMDVAVKAGEHIYVVAARKNEVINAPKHRAPQQTAATIPDSKLPLVIFGDLAAVDQNDVYNVKVKYHLVEHTIDLTTDMFTNKADFELYTTAGTVDPVTGKTFCGLDLYCKINTGKTEDITGYKTVGGDPELVKETVSLSPGTYTYSVYMINRYKDIEWCDRFTLNVKAATCISGLVYSKWDDFLFVDNGDGGGKGTFVAYQWYNSGKAIVGATEQWLRTTIHENAMPTGSYYVKITDNAGNVIVTCPQTFPTFPRSEAANHHGAASAPARKQIVDGQLLVEFNGKWYNAQGMEIK